MFKAFLRKWVFLFSLIVSDLIIALRTGREFFYFFFWFLVSFAAVTFIWLLIQYLYLKKVYLTRRAPGKIEEDDILQVETVINNANFFPLLNVVIEDYLACAVYPDRQKRTLFGYLRKRSSVTLKYSCRCPQRGRYKLGPFSIYIFDPWGLFFLKKNYFIHSELYVYPRPFNIREFPPLVKGTAPWFGIETSHVSGDEHEFYGVREYRQGDPVKRIHWLSTARKNRLIVRQFQQQSFCRATILFNLNKENNFGRGKDTVAEYTVKIAASAAKHLLERDVSLEVIAHAGETAHIPFNKGPGHLEGIFKLLAGAQAESRVGIDDLFREFSSLIANDSSLIVIMPDKDLEYLYPMLSLKIRNISLIPLILVTSSFLGSFDKTGFREDMRIKLPSRASFTPIFFFCHDRLEENFAGY